MNRLTNIIVALFVCFLGTPNLQAQETVAGAADSIVISTGQMFNPMLPQNIRFAPLWSHHGLMGGWDLHEGFNANVDMGVRVGWGKYNPWKGASFFTHFNAMYVQPLSKDRRWNAAVGGYYSNFKMWGDRKNSVGIMGLVDYQINERMNAGVFITHDFGLLGDDRLAFTPMPWLGSPSTTIGADWGIKASDKVRFNVSVSYTRFHDNFLMPQPVLPVVPENGAGRSVDAKMNAR